MTQEQVQRWFDYFVDQPFNTTNAQVSQINEKIDKVVFLYHWEKNEPVRCKATIAFRDRTAYKLLMLTSPDGDSWRWKKGEWNPCDNLHIAITDSIYIKIHPGFQITKDPVIRVHEMFYVTINGAKVGPMFDHNVYTGKGQQISFPAELNNQKFLYRRDAEKVAKRFSEYYNRRMAQLSEQRSKQNSKKKNKEQQ